MPLAARDRRRRERLRSTRQQHRDQEGEFQGLLARQREHRRDRLRHPRQGPMVSVYGNVCTGQSGTLQFPPISFASSGTDGLTGPLPLPSSSHPFSSEAASPCTRSRRLRPPRPLSFECRRPSTAARATSTSRSASRRSCAATAHLEPLEGWAPLEPAAARASLARSVGASDPKRLAAFHEHGRARHRLPGPGLPRFRVNAFRQRGEISLRVPRDPGEVPELRRARASRRRRSGSPTSSTASSSSPAPRASARRRRSPR